MMLRKLYTEFTNSEKASGIILLICTALSLLISNSSIGNSYIQFWHFEVFSKPLEFWINDGLMTVFFLLVGLEIEREFYIGELSDVKKSILPIVAAVGGMLVPALIHLAFNEGSETQNGFAIPMATDIAFSLAVLSLLGSRVPAPLKIFLTALAIIDDLGAIIVIALFYSNEFSMLFFGLAGLVFFIMLLLRKIKVFKIRIYLLLGIIMWFFMYRSGVHATITGVLLAFVIPFGNNNQTSVSHKLQQQLHLPVAFFVLPVFALANTAFHIPVNIAAGLSNSNCYGIMLALLFGKPIGIVGFSFFTIYFGWCKLPRGVTKQHIIWISFLAGIGFTMSVFITLLAFTDPETIDVSKIAVIIGSLASAIVGLIGLRITLNKQLT